MIFESISSFLDYYYNTSCCCDFSFEPSLNKPPKEYNIYKTKGKSKDLSPSQPTPARGNMGSTKGT